VKAVDQFMNLTIEPKGCASSEGFWKMRLGLGLGLSRALGGESSPFVSFTVLGVVFDGDSITQGVATNTASFPSQFSANTGISTTNDGLSGDTLATMVSQYAARIAPLYNASTKNTLFMLGGTNDLGNDGKTDTDLKTSVQSYASQARATGYKSVIGTIPPRSDSGWTGTMEGYRIAYNSWLLSNWRSFADGIVDIAAIPEAQDTTSTLYYQDKLHPTNRLARAFAEKIRTIFRLSNVNDTVPDSFSFLDVAGAGPSTLFTSDQIEISGFTAPAAISISGGQYSINGGAFTSAAGAISPYDLVAIQSTSAATVSTAVNAVLTIGGVSDTYTVTTASSFSPTTTAFDTTPLGASWTYSNSDRTVAASPANGTVLTATAITAKQAFAVQLNAFGANYGVIGISDGGAGSLPSPGFGNPSLSIGWTSSASQFIWANNGMVSAAPAWGTVGQIMGVVVDGPNRLAWFTVDGVNFVGAGGATLTAAQVAAGTSGFNLATAMPSGSLFGAVAALDTGGKGYTLQTEWPSGWTMPSGFSML
jgi:lysophospholipase L1-like esterase